MVSTSTGLSSTTQQRIGLYGRRRLRPGPPISSAERSAAGQPFFLNVTTYSPHVAAADKPAVPAPRDAGLFPTLAAPQTANWNEADISDKPSWLRNARPNLLTAGEINQINSWYVKRVQSLQSVDDMILSIVNMLKSKGEFNNTYIFYSSDNGYHMGNHRMPQGKESPYEEDVRVPLWVIGPGVPAGQTRDQLIINTDFAPTFCRVGRRGSSVELRRATRSYRSWAVTRRPSPTGEQECFWNTA